MLFLQSAHSDKETGFFTESTGDNASFRKKTRFLNYRLILNPAASELILPKARTRQCLVLYIIPAQPDLISNIFYTGNIKVKVDPLPNSLLTVISPPSI